MTLRRGSKTEANDLSLQVRAELGLKATDRLDPTALAAHLTIPMARFSDFIAAEPAVATLLGAHSNEVSALTIHCGSKRLILLNDSQALVRQHSSACHELAHALLLHEPHVAVDEYGCRHWNGTYEQEADWLAGALLVPNEAAREIVRRRVPETTAQALLGVSPQMLTWRINMSGAKNIFSRRTRA
jgi:hypothetical protein